ncbi:sugar kinase [bacterium]|nr:sugar kinase [bacterium]
MRIVTFGEVMLRLAPSEFYRLPQAIPGSLDATFGGGELNVAVSVAHQGGQSAFLTASPDNPITDCLTCEMAKLGVDTDLIQRTNNGRFGIYFVETGANQRGSSVTYDRNGSSIALCGPDDFDFSAAFKNAKWFHITGITPAISKSAAAAALAAVTSAKSAGLTVSCDLNYRSKLWNWEPDTSRTELAQRTMRELMPHIDVVIANEEDCERSLGIKADNSNIETGELNLDGYEHVAKTVADQFPNVTHVAITLRESISASHNNWGAMLFDAKNQSAHFAPLSNTNDGADAVYQPYEIRNIVDRVGAGDSFAGALIFAMNTPEVAAPETAIRYATAASCLKHSIKGDFNYSSRTEIEALMNGSASGRVHR